MKFVFILKTLDLGGIETFVLRLSRELVRQGKQVSFICYDQTGASLNAPSFFELGPVYSFKDLTGLPYPLSLMRGDRLQTLAPLLEGAHVHTTGTSSLVALSTLLRLKPGMKLQVSCGMYHASEFQWSLEHSLLSDFLRRSIQAIGPFTWLVFNSSYGGKPSPDLAFAGGSLVKSVLGISAGSRVKLRPKRLVSVGRLVAFKTYYLHLLDVLGELKREGLEFECDLYGDGELLEVLRQKITISQLEERVFLKGVIPYAELTQAFENRSLFIGSGTALLEAAMRGLPCMVGIENLNQPETYGYFSQIEGDIIHYQVPGRVRVSMKKNLSEHLRLEHQELEEKAEASLHKAQRFSITQSAQDVISMAAGAKQTREVRTTKTHLLGLVFFFLVEAVKKKITGHSRYFDRYELKKQLTAQDARP